MDATGTSVTWTSADITIALTSRPMKCVVLAELLSPSVLIALIALIALLH